MLQSPEQGGTAAWYVTLKLCPRMLSWDDSSNTLRAMEHIRVQLSYSRIEKIQSKTSAMVDIACRHCCLVHDCETVLKGMF